MNILQPPTPCKLLNTRNLRPKYPPGGRGYPLSKELECPRTEFDPRRGLKGILAMRLGFSTARMLFVMMLFAMAPSFGLALDNGLGRTPLIGWNSWDKFACKGLNEKVVRETADAIASNGMKDAGYQFVILDDCWQTGRDAAGNILPDAERFPSGIRALADYINGKALKLGFYSDAGT